MVFPPASRNLKQTKRCNIFLLSFKNFFFKKNLPSFSPDTTAIISVVGTQIYFCIFVNKQGNNCRNNATFQLSLASLTQAASAYLEQMGRYDIGKETRKERKMELEERTQLLYQELLPTVFPRVL